MGVIVVVLVVIVMMKVMMIEVVILMLGVRCVVDTFLLPLTRFAPGGHIMKSKPSSALFVRLIKSI